VTNGDVIKNICLRHSSSELSLDAKIMSVRLIFTFGENDPVGHKLDTPEQSIRSAGRYCKSYDNINRMVDSEEQISVLRHTVKFSTCGM